MSITPTDLLRSMDIFEEVPVSELEKVANLLTERRLAEEELVFKEGDPADGLYLVTGGRIKLFTVDQAGTEKVLANFGDGEFLGEAALLTGGSRSASAQAAVESKVLVLRKDDFDALVATNPTIMREMLKVAAKRQAATHARLGADETRTGVGTGKVWVVFGPRGGSGKTTLAVNLAIALEAQNQDRVALMDLDLIFGHVPLMLNLVPQTSLAAVSSEELRTLDRESLNQYLQIHESGLRVFIGATRPEEGEAVTEDHVTAALEVMRRQFVHIVVDAPSNLTEPVAAALKAADKVLLVGTPELASVRDIREVQRIFSDLLHIHRSKMVYIVNQVQPFRMLSREQFQEALEIELTGELPHAGDLALRSALKGEPLITAAGRSPFVKALDAVVEALGDGAEPDSGQKGGGKPARRGLFGRGGNSSVATKPAPRPVRASKVEASSGYPVVLTVDYPGRTSRLLALFRPLLALPALVFWSILGFVAWLATIPAWFAILILGRLPSGLYRVIEGALRVQTNVFAYLAMLTDAYPPFSGSTESPRVSSYPVQVVVQYPGHSSRLMLFLRFVLVIPHLVMACIYTLVVAILYPVVWLLAVVLGKVPGGLHRLMLGFNRYTARLSAWLLLLVDPFPPLGLKA